MSLFITTQDTPNPNALKFILAKDVKASGKISYHHPAECLNVPLASHLLGISGVSQIHLFENVVTVTQDGSRNWPDLEFEVVERLKMDMPSHDANFEVAVEQRPKHTDPDLLKIDEILDRSIRPGLQADGGDVQVIELTNNLLSIKYEGACGSCPSSREGTLSAIEGILRNEFRDTLEIVAI